LIRAGSAEPGYGPRSGAVGRALLLTSILGGRISLAGILLMDSSDAGWSLWAGGLLGMTLALCAFGGVAIRRRIFTRWYFALLLAGVTIPVRFGLSVAIETGGISPGDWIFSLGVSAAGIGLVLLGYRIQADAGFVPQGAAT
jgi:Na+-transporting NADH:ubiquinone oxidoreductase subunit NqrB